VTEPSSADVALPPSLQRLWDRAGRAPEPKPGLSLERIVAAAIEIADAEGLGALSMARLAERLGSAPMSLYRHVTSKDELYDFMIDAVGRDPEPPPADDWRTGLRAWAAGLMELYTRHPWILQLPVTRPPLEPGQLDWLEQGLRVQQSSPLPLEAKMAIVSTVLYYARGQAALSNSLVAAADPSFGLPLPYGQLVAQLVESQRYPVLSEAVAAGLFGAPLIIETADPREVPDIGLELILDGVAAMISRQA
jgi:AcrR family transcriptional regulator